MARAHLVDSALTRSYHCMTRCVRRAFLLSEGSVNRPELAESLVIAVGGFSVLDNHLHVLVRLDPDVATG